MAEEFPAGGPAAPLRIDRARARLGRLAPYAVGALVVIVAVLLYDVLAPGTPPITQGDVNDTVAKALASVTPPPAYLAGPLPGRRAVARPHRDQVAASRQQGGDRRGGSAAASWSTRPATS